MKHFTATGRTTSYGSWSALAPALSSAWVSDIGHHRSHQEDRAAAGPNFVVIADGVGSVPGGGEAAQVAVGHFSALITGARAAADVVAVFRDTDQLIRQLTRQGVLPPGCATTLTAAVLLTDGLLIANVGDSPGWLLEADGPRSVVRLHRRWDPFRESFVLLSALGSGEPGEPALTRLTLPRPVRLVLASDGILTDPASPDPPSVLTLAQKGDPATAARRIVDAVLEGSARDNLTVAVLDVGRPEGT
jgi:serine/threonine protein phosphatase PrpC